MRFRRILSTKSLAQRLGPAVLRGKPAAWSRGEIFRALPPLSVTKTGRATSNQTIPLAVGEAFPQHPWMAGVFKQPAAVAVVSSLCQIIPRTSPGDPVQRQFEGQHETPHRGGRPSVI